MVAVLPAKCAVNAHASPEPLAENDTLWFSVFRVM